MVNLLFLTVVGLTIYVLVAVFTPATAPPAVPGSALIALYGAAGFLSVGVFGLLSLAVGVFATDAAMAGGWRYGAGAITAAAVLYALHRLLLAA